MAEDEAEAEYTQLGTLRVARPAPRAELLDILIAGGGPGGTAAAMRALELGLSVLVLEADDLLTKIRDFHEGKEILPDYGVRKDNRPFPPGGALLTALHFEAWKREEMLERWKALYKANNVSVRIGAELTGLERGGDGAWTATAWSRRASQQLTCRARNVILAVGGNVARRFDIPGDLNGIHFRLDRAENFVGGPALVVGGGISAAEAVIAISNAKAKAGDATAVYWSYHGEALPRVAESKALGAAFYDAYVGNGNIRYLARSDPAAIFAGVDQREYLSVRIDRKHIEGRPIETVHLEFPKERVIACIGADLPFQLIESLGAKVPRVNDRRYMLVNGDGELSLPNVFLVGDARGDKFLRCGDFNDQGSWEWIAGAAANRNIKAAMWEAVLAVETIAVRAGNSAARVALAAAPALTGQALGAAAAAPAATAMAGGAPARPPAAVATPQQPARAAASETASALLQSVLPDGSVEAEHPLTRTRTTIGRGAADISSPGDVHLAALHASVSRDGAAFVLEDSGSSTGTWLRIQGIEGRALAEGDLVWLGSQLLMATRAGGQWAVAHYDGEGTYRASYPVGERGLFIGRGAGVALDETDTSLSRRHAQFRVTADGLRVFDLGSKNGTLVKVNAPTRLRDGDEFRVGSRRYRFEQAPASGKLTAGDVVVDAPGAGTAAPAASSDGAVVDFVHPAHPASFPVAAGQDILHAYFEHVRRAGGDPEKLHGELLDWSCLAGTCGLCMVKVLAGPEHLEPVGAGSPELDTLENKCALEPDPSKFRLACKAKIKGAVKLGVVE